MLKPVLRGPGPVAAMAADPRSASARGTKRVRPLSSTSRAEGVRLGRPVFFFKGNEDLILFSHRLNYYYKVLYGILLRFCAQNRYFKSILIDL